MLALALVAGSAGFAPAKGDDKAGLEYSKQLYGEGEEAMADGAYGLALSKFQEGYRYAPSLHIFTFNIATAADLAGDCATAKKYFQHFVDLVPEHKERKAVKRRLTELNETCTASIPEVVTPGPKTSRKTRKDIEAERALNLALSELEAAYVAYSAAAARHKATRQIGRAARRKKRHAKRMRKLVIELGVEVRPVERKLPGMAVKVADACRHGRAQESRIVTAMEEVLDWYDGAATYRVVHKFIRWSERIDRPAFEECT